MRKEVAAWLFPADFTPGKKTWAEIHTQRALAGKVLVLCSTASLMRDGILKEIERQIEDDPTKIIPVCLDLGWRADGYEIKRGSTDLKPELLVRNYVDFSSFVASRGMPPFDMVSLSDRDYDRSFKKLLAALACEKGPPNEPKAPHRN